MDDKDVEVRDYNQNNVGDQFRSHMDFQASPWNIGAAFTGKVMLISQSGSGHHLMFPEPYMLRAFAKEMLDLAGQWERGEIEAPKLKEREMNSTCTSCGAQIIWLKTVNNKAIPLDVKPADDGNMLIDDGVARVIKKGETPPAGKLRWKSHFATCPNAAQHRK